MLAFLDETRRQRPGGTLAVQIPVQREHPVHAILHTLAQSEKWRDLLTPRPYNNLLVEEYFDLLSEISADFELWKTVYFHRMPDHESILEWYRGAGLRPYLEQLSNPAAKDFENDVLAALQKEYPHKKNGEILFAFPRLFFIATKGATERGA
jgi:trans-aconitate 2-methyltransferase